MRLLLTNDDGVDALGLSLLAELCGEQGRVTVVAPEEEQSGVGHRVHTRRVLRLSERGEGCFVVDGTPADCVRVGLRARGFAADWVLSGLNHGGNLGVDLVMSGTVAGAREGAILGCQAMALSQVLSRAHPPDPVSVRRLTGHVLGTLLNRPLGPGEFYNVNLPFAPERELPEVVFCEPDPSPHDVRYREADGGYLYDGVFLDRPHQAGTDVDVVWRGKIAVSVLRVV